MTRYFLSPLAREDLDEIWSYSAERWNERRAESYVRDIKIAAEKVATDPRKRRPCDGIRKGYFKQKAGSHMIFYRLAKDSIVIMRIFHEKMDVNRHL